MTEIVTFLLSRSENVISQTNMPFRFHSWYMIECGTHSSFLEFGSNAQAISDGRGQGKNEERLSKLVQP